MNDLKQLLTGYIPGAVEVAKGLVPGALGAAVAVAVQGSMPWFMRFIQLTVGIVVSYYAGEIAAEIFDPTPMVRNGIGFVAGIGAFETVKSLRTSIADVAKEAPGDMWDWWKGRWSAIFGGGTRS